jgi:hypothetical protein
LYVLTANMPLRPFLAIIFWIFNYGFYSLIAATSTIWPRMPERGRILYCSKDDYADSILILRSLCTTQTYLEAVLSGIHVWYKRPYFRHENYDVTTHRKRRSRQNPWTDCWGGSIWQHCHFYRTPKWFFSPISVHLLLVYPNIFWQHCHLTGLHADTKGFFSSIYVHLYSW